MLRPLTNLPALFANEFSGAIGMDNQRVHIARLTMMALRCGLVLLEPLLLPLRLHLLTLEFERLMLHSHGAERAGYLLTYPNEL